MADKFFQFFSKDSVFWFCAVLGTGLFFLQFLLTLLGGDSPDSVEEGGCEIDASKIQWLSKQAVCGFLMMFGWVGLTCSKELEAPPLFAISAAFAAGVIAVFVNGLLFKGARKLKSSGTVFQIEDVIGKEATVYQRIPCNGTGKVTVSLHQLTHEIDAISNHPEELLSFTQVQIIEKSDDHTVIVTPIG